MSELRKHIRSCLFGNIHTKCVDCSLPDEVIIDGLPVFIKLIRGYGPVAVPIKVVLYNIQIIGNFENEDWAEDYNLLQKHVYIPVTPDIDENIEICIRVVRELVISLRFDAYLGQFVSINDCDHQKVMSEFMELFTGIDTVSCKIPNDQCCICFENTRTKSKCNHSICMLCVSKIVPIPTNCEELECMEYEILCPICRADLLF